MIRYNCVKNIFLSAKYDVNYGPKHALERFSDLLRAHLNTRLDPVVFHSRVGPEAFSEVLMKSGVLICVVRRCSSPRCAPGARVRCTS